MFKSTLYLLGICLATLVPALVVAQVPSDTAVRRTVTKEATEVSHTGPGTVRSVKEVGNVIKMNESELFKAACCNLSESFETNPSVDVSYTDATSGTKQIQMLGLSGIYMQLMTENRLDMRGAWANYGLGYVPGTWVQSMQLSKGAGSVANGFESITGALNVEQKKPDSDEVLYLNAYANHLGRMEGNAVLTQPLGGKWHMAIMGHWDQWNNPMDLNKDGYWDMPTNLSHNWAARWLYKGDKWRFQAGFRYLSDLRWMKQDITEGSGHQHVEGMPMYESRVNTTQWEGFMKLGRIFSQPYRSLGFITNATSHLHSGTMGIRDVQVAQRSLYANVIYQDIWGSTLHKYRTGISYQYDDIQEQTQLALGADTSYYKYRRLEHVPGLFYEHTWSPSEAVTVVAGLRGDWNSLFGSFLTPRLHVRYALDANNTLRFSAGRGQRTANPLGDNLGLMATNRVLFMNGSRRILNYHLAPEVAWNYGLSYGHDFELGDGNGTVTLDAYHTWFQNQVVADWETAGFLQLRNVQGGGQSLSLQAEVSYVPARRWEVRTAYRWYHVTQNLEAGWNTKPLVAAHRAFANVAYTTRNKWSFDLTASVTGTKRLPSTQTNATRDQFITESPAYLQVNGQVTKAFKNGIDVYVGVENLTDYRQEQLLIAGDRPFGATFDGSMIWGPIMGRVVYAGVRFKLKRMLPEVE